MNFNTFFVLLIVSLVSKCALSEGGEVTTPHYPVVASIEDLGYVSIPGLKYSYKYYEAPQTWEDAKVTCDNDGAILFYPENEFEINTVMEFWKRRVKSSFPNAFNIGAKKTQTGFVTVEGIPISSIYEFWANGEPNNVGGNENYCAAYLNADKWLLNDFQSTENSKFAFICKSPVGWNQKCKRPENLNYIYSEQLGKCYKFHLTPKTWSEARAKCNAEHADLAVINSQDEADYLVQLTKFIPRARIPGTFLQGIVLLGFYKNEVGDWQTIEGTSLYDSGYACWGNSEPDGQDRETCGSMFYNGHLNDVGCDQKSFFICEHSVPNYAYEPPTAIKSLQCYSDILTLVGY